MPMDQLMRFVMSPDGILTPDLTGRLPGRGAHLQPTESVLEEAVKAKCFDRAFKQSVEVKEQFPQHVRKLIESQLLQRLSMARRSGDLAVGQDAVFAAASSGKLSVLILPADATDNAAARLAGICRDFPNLTFSTALAFGTALGKARVTNLAITHSAKGEQFWKLAHKFRDFLAIKFHEPQPEEIED